MSRVSNFEPARVAGLRIARHGPRWGFGEGGFAHKVAEMEEFSDSENPSVFSVQSVRHRLTKDMPASVRELPDAVWAVSLTQASEGFAATPETGTFALKTVASFSSSLRKFP